MIEQPRGTGITEALIEACKRKRGIYVCHSLAFARELEKRYGVDAISVEQEYAMVGTRRQLFFDHRVTEYALNKMWEQEQLIRALRIKLDNEIEYRESLKIRLDIALDRADKLDDEIKVLLNKDSILRKLEDIFHDD